MRFSVAAVLALASAVFAQDATDGFNVVTKPTEGESVPAGETYEIVWTPDTKYGDKPVSITLVGGKSQPEQQVIELLAESVPSSAGSFSWEVDASYGEENVYGLKVVLLEDPEVFQWSFPFKITPVEGGSSSSAVSSGSYTASSTGSASVTKSVSESTAYPTLSESSTTFSSVYSVPNNLSTTAAPSSAAFSATSEPTGASTTTAAPTGPSTAAANAFAANGLAVIGGLAMAVLAL